MKNEWWIGKGDPGEDKVFKSYDAAYSYSNIVIHVCEVLPAHVKGAVSLAVYDALLAEYEKVLDANDAYREEVLRNRPDFESSTLESKLSMGGLGVAGEAGEVADQIKKILFHGKGLTEGMRQKLILEIGDVHWYLEFLAATLDISTEEIKELNVKKLRARWPEPPKFEKAMSQAVTTGDE